MFQNCLDVGGGGHTPAPVGGNIRDDDSGGGGGGGLPSSEHTLHLDDPRGWTTLTDQELFRQLCLFLSLSLPQV